jgi:hypothetical protein
MGVFCSCTIGSRSNTWYQSSTKKVTTVNENRLGRPCRSNEEGLYLTDTNLLSKRDENPL